MQRHPLLKWSTIGCVTLMGIGQVILRPEAFADIIRPEVIIVLDTSGSMNLTPSSTGSESSTSGSDCGGNRAGIVDICGDGMCSGLETLTGCSADCTISQNSDHPPGMGPACRNNPNNSDTQKTSRMYMVKRVLRNILPSLREQVNVGLVTFQQDGYFEYFHGYPQAPRKLVTAYFPLLQLELMNAWDTVNNAPLGSFISEGVTYTLVSSSGLSAPVDSLYNNVADATEEARFAFSSAGHSTTYNAKDWQYIGSFYTFEQQSIFATGTWLGDNGCSSSNRCSAGEGDCDTNSQCESGLICVSNVGDEYWNPGDINTGSTSLGTIDICEEQSVVQTTYHGPQYVNGSETWVYRRFVWGGWDSTVQGIDPTNNGSLIVPLAASDVQAAIDPQLLKILIKLNLSSNGGLLATGNTPNGEAIETAGAHFIDRVDGTGPFSAADFWSYCRARFVLVLTDGESNSQDIEPETATVNLYNLYPDNPVRTLAVALPGLTSSGGLAELAAIADLGDDGVANGSTLPFSATNEQELIQAIEDAIAVGVGGGDSGTIACYKSCGVNNPCPLGQVCINNSYCIQIAPTPDGGVYLDGAVQDGGAPDSGATPDTSSISDGSSGLESGVSEDQGPLVHDGFMADQGPEVDDASSREGGLVGDAALIDSASGSDAQSVGDGGGSHDVSGAGDTSSGTDSITTSDSTGSKVDKGQGSVDTGYPMPAPSDGCNCAVTDSPTAGAWLFWLGLIFFARRRRR